MSTAVHVSQNWTGFDKIKYLIIFGDSYSSIGYTPNDGHPSAERPLGIEFPGLTSCERVDETTNDVTYDPNWVGHLVQSVNSARPDSPLLVYDYAVSGDTIARVKLWQIRKEFIPQLGPHLVSAPWAPLDTLFLTWIGINDCSWNLRLRVASSQPSFDDLFAAQDTLYKAGARNFCLVDIPPLDMLPEGPKSPSSKEACVAWKSMLLERAQAFSATHSDATVLVFSSWDLFTKILANPQSIGFSHRKDLFTDGIHPITAVHRVFADDMQIFLENVV